VQHYNFRVQTRPVCSSDRISLLPLYWPVCTFSLVILWHTLLTIFSCWNHSPMALSGSDINRLPDHKKQQQTSTTLSWSIIVNCPPFVCLCVGRLCPAFSSATIYTVAEPVQLQLPSSVLIEDWAEIFFSPGLLFLAKSCRSRFSLRCYDIGYEALSELSTDFRLFVPGLCFILWSESLATLDL